MIAKLFGSGHSRLAPDLSTADLSTTVAHPLAGGRLRRLLRIRGLRWGLALVLAMPLSGWAETAGLPAEIRICDDGAEWPPFTYRDASASGEGSKIHGFSVDVVARILGDAGIAYQIKLPSWRRCLHEVFTGGLFQMLLSASYSDERAAKAYLSKPYFTARTYYFYSKRRYPKGLKIKSAADLNYYKIGGVSAYNYDYLGIPTERMEREADTYDHLMLKLMAGRIDVLVAEIEVIRGFRLVGKDYLAVPDLGYEPVPGLGPKQFYMMFSRNEMGLQLKQLFDAGLERLEQDGRMASLREQYGLNHPEIEQNAQPPAR